MNAIILGIGVTSFILLIYALLMRSDRGITAEELQEERRQNLEEEKRRLEDEPPLPSADGDLWLIQQPEPDHKLKENVTPSLTSAADRSNCPACGAIITANDERCPSCEIAFIADGSQKWTLGTAGPADGIFLSPIEFRE